ncbi:hypothetical protein INT48_009560 [Thamnidium elegans]|uniref:C2H2-type domain-containing protein n=1 Tax=Thamnidium elegans TaxID=101142 RepID=A0A8H7SYL7_9FUNG|nr:hypothetical protein INT48_009560 [Thamnidium elegans]
MDKENTNPNTGPKCEECNITFKKENEKYKHNYNFHQKNVISEADGVLCEMRTNQAGFYTCMECKDKIKGYELLKRHYNKRHTSSILCNNKRNFTEFTFEEGCERQGIEAKKSKAVHLVKGVGMVPTMLSLLDEDENNVYHLYNTIEEVKARKIQDLKLFEKDLTCQLKIYNNNSSESSDKVEIVPSRVLYFYDFPAFNEKMGEYIVIDEEIEYSHAESSYASFPQTIDVNDRYYKSIKTIIISQSEGGQPINKLIIGTSSLNILVTSTFKLTPRCNEMSTAGPAAPSVLNGNDLSNAQILFRKLYADN